MFVIHSAEGSIDPILTTNIVALPFLNVRVPAPSTALYSTDKFANPLIVTDDNSFLSFLSINDSFPVLLLYVASRFFNVLIALIAALIGFKLSEIL